MEQQLIIRFYRPQIGKHRVPFYELGNEGATRRVLPDDFRHVLLEVASRVVAKLFHVARFAAVVEFFFRPGDKLADRLNQPVDKTQPQTPDQVYARDHESDITGKIRLHTRALNFDRYLATAEITKMHLSYRGRG